MKAAAEMAQQLRADAEWLERRAARRKAAGVADTADKATAATMRLAVSPPFVAQSAKDSFKNKSPFTLVTLDVEGDGPKHHAAIMVWGDGADVAAKRARTIMQAVNSYSPARDAALLEALKRIAKMYHADTCSHALVPETTCTCHRATARTAITNYEAQKND